MKPATVLLAISTTFFSTTGAQVHPHIHKRCAANSTISASASAAPPLTTLSTSFMLAPTPSALPTTLATSIGSASPPASSASASASAPSPATPSTSADAGTGKQVTINPGDTLEIIAAANGVGICDIAKANAIQDPNLILAGEMLTIPVLVGEKDDRSCLP
jgi:LysM repeat protein